jgi:hypothetical protein
MLGVYFLMTATWDGNPGLTSMRAAGLALIGASILVALPGTYLQGFLIPRALSQARQMTKLRADY